MDIIQDSLKYYDENNLKYSKYMEKVHYIRYKKIEGGNIDGMICIFHDIDKKELFRSKVELVGKHYKKFNIWSWAWGLPLAEKSLINTIKNIFIYATDIYSQNGFMNSNNIILKQNLLTSRLLINNKIQLDIYCALSSYLSKIDLILELPPYTINPISGDIRDLIIDFKDKNNLKGLYWFIHTPPDITKN